MKVGAAGFVATTLVMELSLPSVYQRLPSGPTVRLAGLLLAGVVTGVATPAVVMVARPRFWVPDSAAHRRPPGPLTMSWPVADPMPSENCVTTPAVVMRPTLDPFVVNQRLPSGPVVMPVART